MTRDNLLAIHKLVRQAPDKAGIAKLQPAAVLVSGRAMNQGSASAIHANWWPAFTVSGAGWRCQPRPTGLPIRGSCRLDNGGDQRIGWYYPALPN